jgi:hypothetical protein
MVTAIPKTDLSEVMPVARHSAVLNGAGSQLGKNNNGKDNRDPVRLSDVAEARLLRDEGDTIYTISLKLGISGDSVKTILNVSQVPLTPNTKAAASGEQAKSSDARLRLRRDNEANRVNQAKTSG